MTPPSIMNHQGDLLYNDIRTQIKYVLLLLFHTTEKNIETIKTNILDNKNIYMHKLIHGVNTIVRFIRI